MTFTGFL